MGNKLFKKLPRSKSMDTGLESKQNGRTRASVINNNYNFNEINSEMNENYSSNKKYMFAQYAYDSREMDDLEFSKGDKLEILNSSSGDWFYSKNLKTGKTGYAPSNYLIEESNLLGMQDWWRSGDRRDADKELMMPGNPNGTFLIRRATDKHCYALSVRDFNFTTNEVTVRHYKIKTNQMSQFFISPSRSFMSLIDLVNHYKNSNDGLCQRLTKACPKKPLVLPFRQIEVNRSEIELIEKLGQGQFGEVWKAKWGKRVEVAVKTLKSGSMSMNDFINEAKTMHKLRHNRLVQLLGVCTKSEPIFIITELMPNGALLDYLKKDDGHTLGIAKLIDMATDITEGLKYLENQNVAHRDVRAANILVGANLSCKVADFGLARILQVNGIYDSDENAKFPIKWTSPEAASYRKFSVKSDVWSFGILLYEIFTFGRLPYPGFDNQTTLDQIQKGYRMGRPERCGYNQVIDCPIPVYDIMIKCWSHDPDKRPTFIYLYNFFANYSNESEGQYADDLTQ